MTGTAQTTSPIEAVEAELGLFLRRSRAMAQHLAREVHPDLEPSAYGLLLGIADCGPSRPSELAAYFGIGKATASRQLACLEQLGLIHRMPDPADGRAHLLELTEIGREGLARVREQRQRHLHSRIGELPEEDIALLAGLLHRLNGLLHDPPAKAHAAEPAPRPRP